MAKFEVIGADVVNVISELKTYRSGWANDIREGWNVAMPGAKEILFELYEISGSIILALENRMENITVDKMPMYMTEDKLNKLIKSDIFDHYSAMGEAHITNVITKATHHHIRVMRECLMVLTKA